MAKTTAATNKSSDADTEFHKRWLGMVEPVDGLVVSIPVLIEAQCLERQPPALQRKLAADAEAGEPALTESLGVTRDGRPRRRIVDLARFFAEILGHPPDSFDAGPALPAALLLDLPEGPETLRPTLGLRKLHPEEVPANADSPAAAAGAAYVMLVWDLPETPPLPLAEPDNRPEAWRYPPVHKFDRLLRHCRVSIGLITNREELRLVYAPPDGSTGVLTFRVGDLCSPGGQNLLDALCMLLSAQRFFTVRPEHQLPQLLRDSRLRQANVTNTLADQVLDALQDLLNGFAAAAERDGVPLFDPAQGRDGDHLYGGLLTVLLRLVFTLYAEDKGLLPTGSPLYAANYSVLGLYTDLQSDHAAFPDTQSRRFGAWPRLLALFRLVYEGTSHGELELPARHGELFSPQRYLFLEGAHLAGAAPGANDLEGRAALRVPGIDDETIFKVLTKLLILDKQRLSYRTLDVEQIGSVYEALMGYSVRRLQSAAVCLKPLRVWVSVDELRAQPPGRLAAFLQEEAGLPKATAAKLADTLKTASEEDALLAALETQKPRDSERRAAEALVLQPGPERRRTSSHYTPRDLAESIVRRTLEPLLLAMGERPTSEQLLSLKICDPAMGSGAFLVAACRFLGEQVAAAWLREGKISVVTDAETMQAKRLVAQRCLYGVDKNPFAVGLAKLSLWLETLARDLPFTFVDHALRHGDSLVGLSLEQLRAFHWQPGPQLELFGDEVNAALDEALGYRQRILELASERDPGAQKEKELLLKESEYALDKARAIGDLVIGAFFAHEKDKDREKEHQRRLDGVREWLRGDGEIPPNLKGLCADARERIPIFHWPLEFPEVFYEGRPDPLERGQVNEAAYFDAVVGNPPFMGGIQILGSMGMGYRDWLLSIHQPASGNSDLSAHFFRLASRIIGTHGTAGLIATNTIAQGDTRSTGLERIVRDGVIYDAVSSLSWPGEANVSVSIVHFAQGDLSRMVTNSIRLNGFSVQHINSLLKPKPERNEPLKLASNAGINFPGVTLHGAGFLLTPNEYKRLIDANSKNAERIFPYIGGEEVNTDSKQMFSRYAINFSRMSLAEAGAWPDLLSIVQERVKPERDRLNQDSSAGRLRKENWWRFAGNSQDLYDKLAPLRRCLVISRVTKHLCFSFQPTDRLFSEALSVFSTESLALFALVQSRIHEYWARLLSSSMKMDLRYSASDCFETFPFPREDHLVPHGALERVGEKLYSARARYMVETQPPQGLTATYNQLKDPSCDDPRVVELRRLHEELDRAVLSAYGWSEVPVPPYGTPTTPAEEKALEAFQDEILDRLFTLNAERAAEEQRLGLASTKKPATKAKSKATTDSAASAAEPTAQGSFNLDPAIPSKSPPPAAKKPRGRPPAKKPD